MLRSSRPISLALLSAAMFLGLSVPAVAQTCGDVDGSDSVVASDALLVLKKAVGQNVELTCEGECASLEPQVADLQERIEQLETLLASFSLVGDTVVVTGVNLQIVSGSGSTAGETNGLGNLIVGYNEGVGAQERTGSHNIVVGREHEYTSFGGIVAGNTNTIDGPEATVLGGRNNLASGSAASVSGGNTNTASGDYAAVSGGSDNQATATYASVAGGFDNTASGQHSAIAGGCENTATHTFAHVSGGQKNNATANWASVSGGFNRTSNATHEWTAGALQQPN
ncbi:MAG TPA: hypothetical protein VEC57_01135 [Candidatus Limnocylindrales bacterium]|nr:hypothetical protein [Candidatus Limnocylindrales bacterium]